MMEVGETKNKWFDNLNRALIDGRSVYGDIEARAEGMRKRRERKDNTKLFKACKCPRLCVFLSHTDLPALTRIIETIQT